jgi:hypothetical protein
MALRSLESGRPPGVDERGRIIAMPVASDVPERTHRNFKELARQQDAGGGSDRRPPGNFFRPEGKDYAGPPPVAGANFSDRPFMQ